MVGIDYYFPGYRVVRVVEDDLSKCVGILLKYSMRARVDSDGKIYLKESDVEKFRTHARGIDYSISDTVGLIRCVRWIRHRYATIVAIILSVALIVCSSSIVWDVRISGEYDVPEENLIDGLREAGLTVGMRWSTVDKGQIENKFLALNSNIGWININRRGTVAYVSLVPRGETPVPQINKGVSNIVADRDAVIEEITVYSGKAMVKVGDEVKAGDILISGEVQVGDTAISCRADGIVRGVVSDTVRTQIHSFSDQTYVKNNGVARVSINFFNFAINIYKRYRNLEYDCDIIEEKKEYVFPNGAKLPISVSIEYSTVEYTEREEYTKEQMITLSKVRHSESLADCLQGADLISIDTDASFIRGIYVVESNLRMVRSIGMQSN